MVGRREAWSAWSRQVGRALGVTEYGSLPGWTRLLQGGGLVDTTQTLTLQAPAHIYLQILILSDCAVISVSSWRNFIGALCGSTYNVTGKYGCIYIP